MVEILPLGGLGEIGKNMTAISFGKDCVIIDMGIRLDTLLSFEDLEIGEMGKRELASLNIIPDDRLLAGRRIKGIIISHAHLDHIGAVTKLAGAYKAPIVGTPFTIEVLKKLKREEKVYHVHNRLIPLKAGKKIRLGEIEVEFIHVTHSVPQTVSVLLRKGDKQILYASDFKIDEEPLLGPPMNMTPFEKLNGPMVAMIGTVRLNEQGPIPSEADVARSLREVLKEAHETSRGVIVTTFSSHLARIKSVIEISLELGRLPVIVGRSMWDYLSAGIALGIMKLPKEVKVGRRAGSSRGLLRHVGKEKEEYILICTGHQGEPNSILSLIADGELPFPLEEGDSVVFSSSVIPNPINESNRAILETKLQLKGVKIYRDIHASGHAGRKETIEFLRRVNPNHIVPCHGTEDRLRILQEIARGMGYSLSQVHITTNCSPIEIEHV